MYGHTGERNILSRRYTAGHILARRPVLRTPQGPLEGFRRAPGGPPGAARRTGAASVTRLFAILTLNYARRSPSNIHAVCCIVLTSSSFAETKYVSYIVGGTYYFLVNGLKMTDALTKSGENSLKERQKENNPPQKIRLRHVKPRNIGSSAAKCDASFKARVATNRNTTSARVAHACG